MMGDPELLTLALTHKSMLEELGGKEHCNERLEFLGDAVLGLVVAEHFFARYPTWPEGDLARARARVVCTQSLAAAGDLINLGSEIRMGRGEESTGGRKRPKLLANALEAVLGALYLDQGLEVTRDQILKILRPQIKAAQSDLMGSDYKSRLQEMVQREYQTPPTYEIVAEEGKDHEKQFHAVVKLGGRKIGHGVGRSKKFAEQSAAQAALAKLLKTSSAKASRQTAATKNGGTEDTLPS
jgi:ribonuclease-3